MFRFRRRSALLLCLILAWAITACSSPQNNSATRPERLTVLATTTIVADIVKNVGGEDVEVQVLIPAGVDEHGYEPSPQDVVKASEADLIFINGAGLEGFIETLIRNAGGEARLVSLSDGIQLVENTTSLDEHAGEEESSEEHAGDPHIWTDPNNVIVWVDAIEHSLRAADPEHANGYQARAENYRQQLRALDVWIQEQVQKVPAERRKLVTDHTVFTYFARRYGFEQVGAVIPGYSTSSAPSARQLAALEDAIRSLDAPAIFIGNTINPDLTEQVARDTGAKLVPILTGSLTEPDGPAPTYLEYMRFNVGAIVGALQ